MLFAEVVATSAAVASTSARTAKRDLLAEALRSAGPGEAEIVVGFLVGEPRQGRIGVGWRTIASVDASSAALATLSVRDVDRALSQLAGLRGPGSAGARRSLLAELLGRATEQERQFLTLLLSGEVRHGALAGVMTDAVAAAAQVPAPIVRRAVMLGGRLDTVATIALSAGRDGLERIGLELGRPLQPMLASTADSVADAVEALGRVSVEWKLDGIRIQVHRDGDDVRVWTRNLNEITERLPEVVEVVAALPSRRVALDGEALGMDAEGRPRLFQDTVSGDHGGLRPFFFDVLHLDGDDLIDLPLEQRLDELERVAGAWRIPSTRTDDVAAAQQVLADALSAGHEGVMIKAADSRYEAGRRGTSWRKVKPVHTVDLVVLAAEWGHGRRTGWLSNLHLGARSDDDGSFVMVGKTFKGMTDETLRWQTARLLELAGDGAHPEDRPAAEEAGVVLRVPPVLVAEIAIDGVQRSTRYPGGVALRFARLVRHREDKGPDDVDRISTLRALLGGIT